MTNFRINVVSDTVCPWCYVGHKQLQSAIKMWQAKPSGANDTFTVAYFPYQLNPHLAKGPASSFSKQKYYEDKFGAARTSMMQQRLKQVGDELGIQFKFGGQTGNTRDSHRLVRLAKEFGEDAEGKVIEGLFAAYFENERDITSYDTLREVAVLSGIPEADFQKAIVDSDTGGPEVDEEIAKARAEGVTGVPDFTIQDRFQWSGARDPDDFLCILEKAKASE